MVLLKKLIFTLPFLIVFSALVYQLNTLLISYDFLFSLSINTLIQLLTISALITLSCLLFVLFATLASDWKIVLPVGIASAMIPFLFTPPSLAITFAVGIGASIVLVYLSLEGSLKSYLNFQASTILGPSIRHLSTLLILSFCIVFFLTSNQTIVQKGFQIPDSLIDTALKMTPMDLPAGSNSPQTSSPKVSPEQLALLKQNPELLKQSGLDPSILDAPQNLTQDLIKQSVKDQVQNFIKPYLSFIPAILAVLLFVTLQSLTSIINLLVSPLLWLIFYILEKTGFVKFTTEQRTVRKLIV